MRDSEALMQIFRAEGMDHLFLEDPVIDFPTLAKSMGIKGQRIDLPDKLGKTLKSVLESDKPELIEVPVEGRI